MEIVDKDLQQISDLLLRRREYAKKHFLTQAYKNAVLHLCALYPNDALPLRDIHFTDIDAVKKSHGKKVSISTFGAGNPIQKPDADCDGCLTDAQQKALEDNAPKGALVIRSVPKAQSGHTAAVDKELDYRRRNGTAAKDEAAEGSKTPPVLMRLSECVTAKDVVKYFKQRVRDGEKVTANMQAYMDTANIKSKSKAPLSLGKAIAEYLQGVDA